MIVPDVNLLIYACDSASPFHRRARAWWQACLSGTEPVGLAHVVLFGFIRVSTSGRAFRHPLSVAEATGHARAWLDQPVAQVLTRAQVTPGMCCVCSKRWAPRRTW